MDQQLFEVLVEIKNILIIMAAFVSVACMLWSTKTLINIKNNLASVKRNLWGDEAGELFSRNKIDDLDKLCNIRLIEYPNDADANWWLARCYCSRKDLKKSKEYFDQALVVNPSWEGEADKLLRALEEGA